MFLTGAREISVYWDNPWDSEYLEYDLYKIAVEWCVEEKINSIKDLEKRIISIDDYHKLWLKRCEEAKKRCK